MNTTKSDDFAAKWESGNNGLQRGSITVQRTFNSAPVPFFKLLCPTTELDWLPGFSCELLHSKSGYSEYNASFRTNFFGPEEIWVCTRHEPGKAMEYARTSQDFLGKMDISIADNCDGTVIGSWVVTISALTEAGNQMIANLDAGKAHLEQCLDALAHYVDTGEMIGE